MPRQYVVIHSIAFVLLLTIAARPGSGMTPVAPQPIAGPACGGADVNCDGVVNLLDLVTVSSAYAPGMPASNPAADVNLDGVVDLFDLVAVAAIYGRGQ